MSNDTIHFPIDNFSEYSSNAKKKFLCENKKFLRRFFNSLGAPKDFIRDYMVSLIQICDTDVNNLRDIHINQLIDLNIDFLQLNIVPLNVYWQKNKSNPEFLAESSENVLPRNSRLLSFPPTEPGNDESEYNVTRKSRLESFPHTEPGNDEVGGRSQKRRTRKGKNIKRTKTRKSRKTKSTRAKK